MSCRKTHVPVCSRVTPLWAAWRPLRLKRSSGTSPFWVSLGLSSLRFVVFRMVTVRLNKASGVNDEALHTLPGLDCGAAGHGRSACPLPPALTFPPVPRTAGKSGNVL